jgi:hypothetical protein
MEVNPAGGHGTDSRVVVPGRYQGAEVSMTPFAARRTGTGLYNTILDAYVSARDTYLSVSSRPLALRFQRQGCRFSKHLDFSRRKSATIHRRVSLPIRMLQR